MKFYYHKLGKGNHLAERWLADPSKNRNPLNRPAIVSFFGRSNRNDSADLKAEQFAQVKAFYKSTDDDCHQTTLITVIASGQVWILQPDGKVVEKEDPDKEWTENGDLLKIMPVNILKRTTIKDVPHVLASINANTFLTQGTYREIGYWGNQKAICSVIGIDFPSEHWELDKCNANHLLECLSSTELETLIAKLFETAGCFVPAHRGGVMVDADLFAHNDLEKEIRLDDLIIPPKSSLSIQIKGWKAPKECPQGIDCLIGFDVEPKEKCCNGEWILRQVRKYDSVKSWLHRSLNWLPEKILNHYKI